MADFLYNIPAFVVVLGVLIIVHEMGHFLAAKMVGVGVIKFAVGFGPALFKRKFGETTYQLSLIPLGGYVRMLGDVPDAITGPQETDEEVRTALAEGTDRSRWFIDKGLLAKSWIVFAGPLFNFLLAIALAAFVVFIYGEPDINPAAVVGKVISGSPAERAGLQEHDVIASVNGVKPESWKSFAGMVHSSEGQELQVVIRRGAEEFSAALIPDLKVIPGADADKSKIYLVGLMPEISRSPVGLGESLYVGVVWTATISVDMLTQLGSMISRERSADELAGPVFIFQAAGEQARKGLEDFLSFIALLSVSLAVLNLLPVPVLDGGHLFFFLLEGIFGPISVRKKESAQQVGMVLLLSLMCFAVWNDITRDPEKFSTQPRWEDKKEKSEDAVTGKPADDADPAVVDSDS